MLIYCFPDVSKPQDSPTVDIHINESLQNGIWEQNETGADGYPIISQPTFTIQSNSDGETNPHFT